MERFLAATDRRWEPGCPNCTLEIASSSFDILRTGVGSSPYTGDMGAPGIPVPDAPTDSSSNRYTFILAAAEIPGGRGVIVRGLRQAVTLRAYVEVSQLIGEDTETAYRYFELPVTTPFWSFPDGNVSWHLRYRPNRVSPSVNTFTGDIAPPPGASPSFAGLDSVLVASSLAPYAAVANGVPPGAPVYGMGTFYDIRFPWTDQPNGHLAIPLRGPGVVMLCATVFQTNPETRIQIPPACVVTSVLSPEDQFLAAFPTTAVYGRVAGALMLDMFPGGFTER